MKVCYFLPLNCINSKPTPYTIHLLKQVNPFYL
uniref:Uncharacterized protein n=1 Tax=Rhizophora mucronata TaxID=61149 RepID=A0A2P2J4Z5_RHIMU